MNPKQMELFKDIYNIYSIYRLICCVSSREAILFPCTVFMVQKINLSHSLALPHKIELSLFFFFQNVKFAVDQVLISNKNLNPHCSTKIKKVTAATGNCKIWSPGKSSIQTFCYCYVMLSSNYVDIKSYIHTSLFWLNLLFLYGFCLFVFIFCFVCMFSLDFQIHSH